MWKKFLRQRGLSENIINESKITYIYPWIRIPYLKENIETIKGRWFGAEHEKKPERIPKYIWLRGSPNFPFNWNPVNWNIFIYICEGELDTILLKSCLSNKDNVIGLPFGATTFKDDWADILRKSEVKIFSLLDNDSAGEKGAQKIANKIGRDIQQVVWPSNNIGFDLTDFAKGNLQNLSEKIRHLSYRTIKTLNEDLLVYKNKKINISKDADLDELKKVIPIENVIGKFTRMKSNSLGFQAHCPFHEDKIASLIIYKKTNSFYCFSCGVGGSSLDFLMKLNGDLNLSKAVDFLRNNYGREK